MTAAVTLIHVTAQGGGATDCDGVHSAALLWRDGAILTTLALPDAKHHAWGIDVGHLQVEHCGDAQPGGRGRHEYRASP